MGADKVNDIASVLKTLLMVMLYLCLEPSLLKKRNLIPSE
jgi:hypothetical protein